MRKAISSGQATMVFCLFWSKEIKFEASSKLSKVPVSSQVKPLPKIETSKLEDSKYFWFTDEISNSPLFDGLIFFEISITEFGKKYNPTTA